MSSKNDIFIKIDDFFTQTRIRCCFASSCINNADNEKNIKVVGDKVGYWCMVKQINIDENGKCVLYKKDNQDICKN